MNRNLGNYDMALALSINRINYQFKKMHRRKIIHDSWAFLTNSMGNKVETLTNEKAMTFWESANDHKSRLEAKQEEFKSIDKDISTAIKEKKYTKLEQLDQRKKSVEEQIISLKEEIKKSNLYDLGLIANIEAPKIKTLSDTAKEIVLQISFKPGSMMFYSHEGKNAKYDLGKNEIKYAFKVSIGKIKITSDKKKVINIDDQGREVEKTLRDKGINDNDFTIKALFMDFENANISQYDEKYSKLPGNASHNSLLQAALTNYFKNIQDSENPYVLGYGIERQEVREGEQGLFYPTGVAYSTSHSRIKRASTFNFLMMLNKHAFPDSNDSGVLPQSLMEKIKDTTSTVDGCFAIDLDEFKENYISTKGKHSLTKAILEKLKSSTAHKSDKIETYGFKLNFTRKNIKNGRLSIKFASIENNEENGISIIYETSARLTQHIEKEKEFLGSKKPLGMFKTGTVGIDWDLSTDGSEKPNKNSPTGENGKFIVSIKPDSYGKLKLHTANIPFRLGFSTSEPHYKNKLDKNWDAIASLSTIFSSIFGDIEKAVEDFLSTGINEEQIKKIETLVGINDLGKFENKIILPVSSVYTYKNVRILNNSYSSDEKQNLLLFDTSYAPVA